MYLPSGENDTSRTSFVWPVKRRTSSPDGKYLITSSWDGNVRLWDVTTGTEIRRFIGHVGYIYGAAFSPDGQYILTSGADVTARLWNVKTGVPTSFLLQV